MQPGQVVAIDVGGTSIKAALVDADLRVATALRVPTARRAGSADLDQITDLIDDLVSRATDRVLAVGIVVPGIVDDAGVVRAAVNLGWRHLRLRAELASRSGLPLRVGHDVRAGGLAEFTVGAAAGVGNALFVPLGTGIAAAALVDGHELVAGGFAGEIGHLVVDPGGAVCACGARGCLETLASASGIARRYAELSGRPVRDAAEVVAGVRAGDPVAERVWTDAVAALATALTAAVTLLAPEVIVIGGGLAEAGDALLDPLRAELASRLTFQRRPTVVRAALAEHAGRTGAALLAWQAVVR